MFKFFAATIIATTFAIPAFAVVSDELPDINAQQRSAYHEFYQGTVHNGLGEISSPGGLASGLFAPNSTVRANTTPGYRYTSELTYYFRVDGPASMIVPIIAYAKIAVSKTEGYVQIYAGLNVNDGINTTVSKDISLSDFAAASDSFDGGLALDMQTGVTGSVHLFADAIAGGGSGNSFVDPYIVIDPAFAAVDPDYAAHYSLSFSPGANNDAPGGVPEAATWVLLIAGFGAVGVAARLRRAALRYVAG
jgi:hypothetical protein